MKEEPYSLIVDYKPKGINQETKNKIGNSITALLLTASLLTSGYALYNPDYETIEDSPKTEHIDSKKHLNFFELDKDKQFVIGILLLEAGVLNHVYLKEKTKKII